MCLPQRPQRPKLSQLSIKTQWIPTGESESGYFPHWPRVLDEDGVMDHHHCEYQEVPGGTTAGRAPAQARQISTAALDQDGCSKVSQGVPAEVPGKLEGSTSS